VGYLPWIGLAVFLLGLIAGAVLVVVRGLAAWRVYRSFSARVGVALGDLERAQAGIEPRLAKASASAERLQQARARLDQSLATLQLLLGAFGEVTALLKRVTAFVPR